MKYMGNKNRIAKEILPIILKDRTDKQTYVEPFCGGLGTMDKVIGNRLASDKNKYLIAMWQGLQENREHPYQISKELYSKARIEYNNGTNIEFDDFLIGWIGWMGSYNGRFFDGGYSGHCAGKKKRDYISEQIRNTEKQLDKIQGIDFRSCDYTEIEIPNKSIIYCDIPYRDTKQYATSKDFDHVLFWDWCRDMSKRGHQVFISEYKAPDDFICVWSGKLNSYMKAGRSVEVTECLFQYGG